MCAGAPTETLVQLWSNQHESNICFPWISLHSAPWMHHLMDCVYCKCISTVGRQRSLLWQRLYLPQMCEILHSHRRCILALLGCQSRTGVFVEVQRPDVFPSLLLFYGWQHSSAVACPLGELETSFATQFNKVWCQLHSFLNCGHKCETIIHIQFFLLWCLLPAVCSGDCLQLFIARQS